MRNVVVKCTALIGIGLGCLTVGLQMKSAMGKVRAFEILPSRSTLSGLLQLLLGFASEFPGCKAELIKDQSWNVEMAPLVVSKFNSA